MQESDLGQLGIHIQVVQHIHGSPYGQYWGYVVVQNGLEKPPIYFGKSRKGASIQQCDPFIYRRRALKFAKSLAGDKEQTYEEQQAACEFEHLWVDTGGEG